MSRSTRLVSTINQATIGPLAKCHSNGVSLLRRADSGPWLDDGWAKAQPAVVLILKRLRKRGHGLKSQPTDLEKPGIKPGPLAYKTYATGYVILLFVVVFLGYYSQYWPGGFMFLWFYVPETYCLFEAVFLGCTSTGRVGLWFCGRSTRRLNRPWFWF